ncbi:hypothetical protein [uncultured Psychroserpens sp.]|uniref:hypothetical protein n=1 Tax=uncultured Psychroserpens sp. TaxID=255436 RepID=UPI002612C533|nr:hypothetical protein [uncultured Psychroserpens sp.]
MITAKHPFLSIMISTILVSCTFSNSGNSQTNSTNLSAKRNNNELHQNNLKYNNVYDKNNGLVICRTPLPKDWNYDSRENAEFTITGDHNIKVSKTETHNYAYASDNFSLQSLSQMQSQDLQIAPVESLRQILQNYVIPSAQSQGYSLIKQYDLPSVLKFWHQFESGMLNTGSKRQYNVLGTDWKDANGNRSFIVFVQSIIYKDSFVYWTFQSTELEAPSTHFEKAKNAYIYGLANTQINMQWQQAKNTELLNTIRRNNAFWENATRQSKIAHNQRMAAINARGNSTRSIGDTYSDILDISHAGYLKRNDMNNAGQSKTINMIGERSTISNMATGERYNVNAGSKYYWVNTNGEYFGTDNSFYDPRIDKRINHEQWSQFEIEN